MKLKIILAAALMSAACAFASADDPFADLPEETQAVELPELAQTAADDIARLAAGGVNARARDGSTPLMLAARTGDTQLVRSLLNGGAKVNARNKKGTTALMNAAFFREDAEIARLLIAAGANVNAADKEGWTPLMLALYASESTETAEALVAAGADVNARNKNGWTPLMCALRSGKPAAFITKMLRSWKVHAEEHKNARDGTTPLMIACQYASDPSVVKRLYAAGGEATRARNNGDRPLHFAARNETGAAPAIIQFLLDSRADINGKGSGGWTPLMAAAQFSSHPETVKKMLDAGAVVNARKNDGMTAVMLAATNESPAAEQIASLLIYAGADLDATDGRGRRAYHVAARSAHSLEMLRLVAGNESASLERKQRALLTVSPAAENLRVSTRKLTPSIKRSLAVLPIHKRLSAGQRVTALLVSHDLIGKSEDVSGDALPSTAAEQPPQPSSFGARFAELLRSYDLVPPEPVVSDDAEAAMQSASEDVSPAMQPISDGTEPAAQSVSDEKAVSPAELSPDVFPVISASSEDVSPDITPELSEEEAPVEKAPPASPARRELNAAKAAARQAAWEAAQPREYPAEELSVADLLVSESPENAEANAATAAGLDAALSDAAAVRGEKNENEPRNLSSSRAGGKAGRAASETELLAGVAVASRGVSRPALNAARMRDSQRSNYTKRRTLKKMRPQFRRDRAEVTPLMLAAVNPTDAAPDIIAWLLEQGEDLEARDGEGRTALICAVRYNSSPLAARALIEAGADTRATFNGNALRRLLRFNNRMTERDKKTLVPLLKGKSSD